MTQKKFASRPEYKNSIDSIGRYFRPKIQACVCDCIKKFFSQKLAKQNAAGDKFQIPTY